MRLRIGPSHVIELKDVYALEVTPPLDGGGDYLLTFFTTRDTSFEIRLPRSDKSLVEKVLDECTKCLGSSVDGCRELTSR